MAVSWAAQAQGECPALVERAIEAVGDNCPALDRNSACYGYNLVTATFAEAQPAGVFSEPADRAGLMSLETIRTAPLDLDNQLWGVAVMSVQANVPNSLPGQAVTFILMGEATLTNAVQPDEALEAVEPVTVTVRMVTDVRSAPALNANVIATVEAGAALLADALSEDAEWLRVVVENKVGWINRSTIEPSDRVGSLPVVTPQTYTPMQAFYFTSGLGQPACNEAPSALSVRSPENIRVDLTANGADIHLGSHVTYMTGEDNTLLITVHEGTLEISGVAINAGQTSECPLDEEGTIVECGEPRPATDDELQAGQTARRIQQTLEEGQSPSEGCDPNPTTYTVQRGDNLFRIALRFDMPMQVIIDDNNIFNPRLLFVGQRLLISAPCSGFVGLPPAPVPQPVIEGGDCTSFVITSPPSGGLVYLGQNTLFTASPVAGAANYRFNIYPPQGSVPWHTQESGGSLPNVNLDTTLFGTGDNFEVSADALSADGTILCTTPRVAFTRPQPPPPTVPPVLPDLTVKLINPPTAVSCSGSPVTCTATVEFTVTNLSSVDVAAGFNVLITADQVPSTTLTVSGLAAGATITLSATLGPGGNCYDPDCTVLVTADSSNNIAEADEGNNVTQRTDLG